MRAQDDIAWEELQKQQASPAAIPLTKREESTPSSRKGDVRRPLLSTEDYYR
jgi:hypothetical protein